MNDILWLVRVTLLCAWRGHVWKEFVRTTRGLREHCRYCLRCGRTEMMG